MPSIGNHALYDHPEFQKASFSRLNELLAAQFEEIR